jgi:hypothetical protein
VPKLTEAGAAAVFPTGTGLEVLVTEIRALTESTAAQRDRGADPKERGEWRNSLVISWMVRASPAT